MRVLSGFALHILSLRCPAGPDTLEEGVWRKDERGGLVDDAEWRDLLSAQPRTPPWLVPQPIHLLTNRMPQWPPRAMFLAHEILRIVQWSIPLALVVVASVGLATADAAPGTSASPRVANWTLGALIVASALWVIGASVWSLLWVGPEIRRLEELQSQVLRRIHDASGEFSPMRVLGLETFLQESRDRVPVEVESHRAWSLLWSVYLLLLLHSLAFFAASLLTGLQVLEGVTGVVTPVEILQVYAWHALDVIPLVEVTGTLGWDEPHTASAGSFALSLVLARFLVLVLIASAFRSAWKRLIAAINTDRP